MAGRHPNAMRQADTSAYPLIQDAIDKGFIGTEREYPVDGFTNHEAANRGRVSVGRAAKHFNMSCPCWVVDADGQSCYRDCKDPDAPHGIRFRAYSKNEARAFIAEIAKGDPSKLKYNPFAKRGRKVDDDGKPVP